MSIREFLVAVFGSLAFGSFFFGWLTFGIASFGEQNRVKARVMLWGPLVLAASFGVLAWAIAG